MWGWLTGEEETSAAVGATTESDPSCVPSAEHVPAPAVGSEGPPQLLEGSDTKDSSAISDPSAAPETSTPVRVTFNPFAVAFEKHSQLQPTMISACTPLRCTFYERPVAPAADLRGEAGSRSAPGISTAAEGRRSSVSGSERRKSLMDMFSTPADSSCEQQREQEVQSEEESESSGSLGFDPELLADELLSDDSVSAKDLFGKKQLILRFVNQFDELSEQEKSELVSYHRWIMHDSLTLSVLGLISSTMDALSGTEESVSTVEDTDSVAVTADAETEADSGAAAAEISAVPSVDESSADEKKAEDSGGEDSRTESTMIADEVCLGDVILCYFASFSPTNPDLKGCWHRWLNWRKELTLDRVDYKLVMKYLSKKPMNVGYDCNRQPLIVLDTACYMDEFGPDVTAKMVELFASSILWNLEENSFDFNGLRKGVSIYVDLSQFSVTMASWNVISRVKVASVSYPFGLEKIYCVKAPTIIYLIRQFAATVLVPHAMDKIVMIEDEKDFILKEEYPGIKQEMPLDCGGDWSIDAVRWMGPRGYLMPLDIDDDLIDSILDDDDLELDLDELDSEIGDLADDQTAEKDAVDPAGPEGEAA